MHEDQIVRLAVYEVQHLNLRIYIIGTITRCYQNIINNISFLLKTDSSDTMKFAHTRKNKNMVVRNMLHGFSNIMWL